MTDAASKPMKRVCDPDEQAPGVYSAADTVLCGHSPQVLSCIMAHTDRCWHLFAAGTSRAWRAVYNSHDKTRLTSAAAALASASTTEWAMEADFRDIHRFTKKVCSWKHLEWHKSCAYSSSVCRALRPQQTLELCKQHGCQHQLTSLECVQLATAYGTAPSLKWLLQHKAELVESVNAAPRSEKEPEWLKWYAEDFLHHALDCLSTTAVQRGQVEILQVLYEAGLVLKGEKANLISTACRHEQIHVADWLVAHGFELPLEDRISFTSGSTANAYLWLKSQGVKVCSGHFARAAARTGTLQELQRLYALDGRAWTREALEELMRAASNSDVIKWLANDLGVPLQAECCGNAARDGDIELLDWLHEREAPFYYRSIANSAVQTRHMHVLQYVDRLKLEPWTAVGLQRFLMAAVRVGDVATCDWLYKQFIPEDLPVEWKLHADTPLKTVQWAVAHGMKWSDLTKYRYNHHYGDDDSDDEDDEAEEFKCEMLHESLSCEAFHWAHETDFTFNKLLCTCPSDKRELPSADALFRRRLLEVEEEGKLTETCLFHSGALA